MINWWLGRPADAKRDDDGIEAPETPAPVFAARAFKSALFGTPAPSEIYDDSPTKKTTMAPCAASGMGRASGPTMGAASPTKPQGILLTPGTATARRKTVTFGKAVVDNEAKAVGKSGIPNNCPGKFPSPWTPRVVDEGARQPTRTQLTKSLEAAREGKLRKPSSSEIDDRSIREPGPVLEPTAEAITRSGSAIDVQLRNRVRSNSIDSSNGDMTLDLNEPHSQSGRYWKSEYERYHEEAQSQMKKLVKYKQLAKSYARKKDDEAIDLGEKLREEQEKVAAMEDKIAELVRRIADRNNNGEGDSPQMINDLARQTALTVQYRDKVEEFEAAMEERNLETGENSGEEARYTSPRTAKTLIETNKELKKARKQLEEMSSLRAEIHRLRLDVSAAEMKAIRLQDENAKLSKELARVNDELERSEKRRNTIEDRDQKRKESLQRVQSEYDNLKGLAKSQRRDAELLLKKRHDQVSGLKKEISLLKEKVATPAEEQIKPSVRCTPDIIDQLIHKENIHAIPATGSNNEVADPIAWETPGNGQPGKSGLPHNHLGLVKNAVPISGEGDYLLDSRIPVFNGSKIKAQKTDIVIPRQEDGNTPTNSAIYGPFQPVLGEITNNTSSIERPPTTNDQAAASPFTAFHDRFSKLSLDSPAPAVVSVEPPLVQTSYQSTKTTHQGISPRPSMYNIGSSPPKYRLPRPQSSGNDRIFKSNSNASSSRLSSMNSTRTRVALPPERAAAAKARLEQKKMETRKAEKRRLQEMDEQKENIRY